MSTLIDYAVLFTTIWIVIHIPAMISNTGSYWEDYKIGMVLTAFLTVIAWVVFSLSSVFGVFLR